MLAAVRCRLQHVAVQSLLDTLQALPDGFEISQSAFHAFRPLLVLHSALM